MGISPRWSDGQPVVPKSPATEERQPDDCGDSFQDAMEQNETDPPQSRLLGMTVRTFGLTSAEFNDRLGRVQEYVQSSHRFRVQFDPQTTRAIRESNLQFPAHCPSCDWEVTSTQCFNCGFGE